MHSEVDGGGAGRWWDWALLVEDGQSARVNSLAKHCIECDVHTREVKYQSNKAIVYLRQDAHLITAHFSDGKFSQRKSKLDPREPLKAADCERLNQQFEEACIQSKSDRCTIENSSASLYLLSELINKYAGISYKSLNQRCKKACSTGKTMDRSTFFRQVCRRKGG